jgi:hypothetical protein
MSSVITTCSIVCEKGALPEWQSGFLVKLVGPARVRGSQTLAIQLLNRIDRLLLRWGVINRKTIEAEVAARLGAAGNPLVREKVLAFFKECKSTKGT